MYGLDVDDKSELEIQQLLDNACKNACCYDFIHDPNTFKKGYESEVLPRGTNFSGGQK